MFAYIFSIVLLHRPDCQGLIIPAPYEIFPYYYVSSEYIQQAYEMKMEGHPSQYVLSDGNNVVIKANYSGWYIRWNDEQKLSYFTEDVGLNTFYYHYNLDYPFWMEPKHYDLKKDRYGEIFYYVHQQLLARYYMERLSNGMGEIPDFSWNLPIEEGYYPSLRYHNGLEFPSRPNHFDFHQHEFLQHLIQVEDYERRIRDSIDQGFLFDVSFLSQCLWFLIIILLIIFTLARRQENPSCKIWRYWTIGQRCRIHPIHSLRTILQWSSIHRQGSSRKLRQAPQLVIKFKSKY